MPPNARSIPARHPSEAGRPDDEERERELEQPRRPKRVQPALSTPSYPIQAYIPPYLKDAVRPYHGDFCYSTSFHSRLLTQLMAEGFLPIAANPRILLPKLHEHRCVVPLRDDDGDDPRQHTAPMLHVARSTRKKAKRFAVSANADFDAVVRACHAQHGLQSWLHPPLVQALREMHRARDNNAAIVFPGEIGLPPAAPSSSSGQRVPVRVYSIEVWNIESGDLVAGELGYSVGAIYTSLTGYSRQDSAGSVQLAALGRWLLASGFQVWDLGMEMDYKRSMGAVLWPRHKFVRHVHALRGLGDVQLHQNGPNERYEAKCLIDGGRLVPVSPEPPTRHPQPVESATRQTKKARSEQDFDHVRL